jgi:hypothetical protein
MINTSYTVMWARDHCVALQKAGEEGKPLQVLFGGVHQSAPSLKGGGIEPGDIVFPVSVHRGCLWVLAGVIVREFVEIVDYAVDQLGLERETVDGLHEYEVKNLIAAQCGVLGHRAPYGCGTEVALAERSTPLRFDVTVPPEHLAAVTFCPRKGPPVGLKHLEGGRLASAVSLHGNVRRLCPDSANLFAELVGLSEVAVK